jgi:hypothetical protein
MCYVCCDLLEEMGFSEASRESNRQHQHGEAHQAVAVEEGVLQHLHQDQRHHQQHQQQQQYVRVPEWAQPQLGVALLSLLPVDISGLPRGDPSLMYGVRLCDTFSDASALLKGERGYVIAAIRAAIHSFVIPCAGKDFCLVICGFSAVVSLRPNIFVLSPPKRHVLPDQMLICEQMECFYTFQVLQQTEELQTNPFFQKQIQTPFRKYSIIPVEGMKEQQDAMRSLLALQKKNLCCFMPRHGIITSKLFNFMISLKVKDGFEQQSVLSKVLAMKTDVCGIFLQHRGTIRLLFPSAVVSLAFEIVVDQVKEFCYEISSDDDRFKWTLWDNPEGLSS